MLAQAGESAVEVSTTVPEPVAGTVEAVHGHDLGIRLDCLTDSRIGNVVHALGHDIAGPPQAEDHRLPGADNHRQRSLRARCPQAPRQKSRVVLILVRPAKCDGAMRETGKCALDVRIDVSAVRSKGLGIKRESRCDQALAFALAPTLQVFTIHRSGGNASRLLIWMFSGNAKQEQLLNRGKCCQGQTRV